MSRLYALLAVAVIAFACAPQPVLVIADEPPIESEPELVIPEEEPTGSELRNRDDLSDFDRIARQLVDEMISADNIGPPALPEPEEYPEPEPSYPSAPSWRRDPRWRLFRANGSTAESERAAALGLAWLARQQKGDGSWEFDQGEKADHVAATGLALLPFIRADQATALSQPQGGTIGVAIAPPLPGIEETHQFLQAMAARSISKDRGSSPSQLRPDRRRDLTYQKSVAAGLNFLLKQCPLYGPRAGRFENTAITGQTIATLALCEAYAETHDPLLQRFAQSAVNFLQKSQAPDGGWCDTSDSVSDIFVTGWVIQALDCARRADGLVVDDRVIKNAVKFLDLLSAGPHKSSYGSIRRTGAKPGTTPTAIGLLCRYSIDGWGPKHPGMIEGVAGLAKNPPVGKG